jgi:hypothetical protein
MDSLTRSAIAADGFRMAYRVALAHQYYETDRATFNAYRFSDGTAMRHYLNGAA